MDDKMREDLLRQHRDSYKNAIKEIIFNNTKVLIDDILSFIEKPPLDSMDIIQNKFLDLAKRDKLVLNTDKISDMLINYRSELMCSCDKIKKIRIDALVTQLEDSFEKEEVFSFYKKDFVSINKEIRRVLKEYLNHSCESVILCQCIHVFSEELEEDLQRRVLQEITKYMKGNYQKQILENLDIKLLVKDTTLINGVKEQGERYLFTLKNSRLLNDIE